MTTNNITDKPNWHATPPKWLNRMMAWMLKTPIICRGPGKSVVLLTFTGRKSGKSYTTPVTYVRQGDTVLLLTKAYRRWWRNFETPARVSVVLAGKTFGGTAHAQVVGDETLPQVTDFLRVRSRDAQYYGVRVGPGGEPNPDDIRALYRHVVLVTITLD